MKKLVESIKNLINDVVRPIIDLLTDKARDNGTIRKISLGRTSFLAIFIIAIVIWLNGKDIQPNHMLTLGTLLTYVLGTKIVDGIKVFTGIDNISNKK